MSFLSSFLGDGKSSVAEELMTPLDLVTYAGGLASNPSEIDPLLDNVRKITATRSVEEGLTPTDEATLIDVYIQLENYLATQDPIRTYTKQELRSRLTPELLSQLTTYEAKGGA